MKQTLNVSFIPRVGSTLLLGALSAAALAQTQTIQPYKKVVGPKAVIESTFDGRPRIMPGFTPTLMKPENPIVWTNKQVEPNSLPIGETFNETAITPNTARFPGLNFNGWIPADATIAVGPNKIVETINSDVGIFSKAGTKLFQRGLAGSSGFFGSVGAGSFVFDPKVFYDPLSQRFFLIALDLDTGAKTSNLLIAVSSTSDPEGNWAKYKINSELTTGGVQYWLDYPGWGSNKDAIVCTGNMFGYEGGYAGVQFIVMSKAQMLTGGQPTVTYLRDPGEGTAQVAKTVDPDTDRIYAVTNSTTSQLKVYAIRNLTGTPTVTSTLVAVPSFIYPSVNPTSKDRFLDGFGDARIFTAAWRKGRLVAAHGVQRSSTDRRLVARWYEIDTNDWPTSGTAPKLRQAGNIVGAAGEHNHMPAINVNKRGAISVLYTRSSSTIASDMVAAGRKPTDPLNTMGTPVLLETSTGTYGGPGVNRWGDYWSVEVDPTDDETFWGVTMVGKSDGTFGTAIKSWKIFVPADDGVAVGATSIAMFQGSGTGGTLSDITALDNATYNVFSTATTLGQIAGARIDYTVPQTSVTQLTFKIQGTMPLGATGQLFAWNWATNSYDFLKSYPAPAPNAAVNVVLPAAYRNASNQIRVVTRAVAPTRFGIQAAPFSYKIDLAQMVVLTDQ